MVTDVAITTCSVDTMLFETEKIRIHKVKKPCRSKLRLTLQHVTMSINGANKCLDIVIAM